MSDGVTTEGQSLAVLEDDEQKIEAERTRASYEIEEQEFERARALYEDELLSNEAHEAARRELEDARHARSLAELELERTEIRAPFSGKIVTRHLDVGATVEQVSFVDPDRTIETYAASVGLAPTYEAFMDELVDAKTVVLKEFETRELFQACQPIEETARRGGDAIRFGALKPVGLVDPRTGERPWAVVQLRQDDLAAEHWNLVGFRY